MAAERHFRDGREPAQAIVAVFADQESCLGQVVLLSDGLERQVSEKTIHWHHRSGVSAKPAGGESIDLKDPCAHREKSA